MSEEGQRLLYKTHTARLCTGAYYVPLCGRNAFVSTNCCTHGAAPAATEDGGGNDDDDYTLPLRGHHYDARYQRNKRKKPIQARRIFLCYNQERGVEGLDTVRSAAQLVSHAVQAIYRQSVDALVADAVDATANIVWPRTRERDWVLRACITCRLMDVDVRLGMVYISMSPYHERSAEELHEIANARIGTGAPLLSYPDVLWALDWLERRCLASRLTFAPLAKGTYDHQGREKCNQLLSQSFVLAPGRPRQALCFPLDCPEILYEALARYRHSIVVSCLLCPKYPRCYRDATLMTDLLSHLGLASAAAASANATDALDSESDERSVRLKRCVGNTKPYQRHVLVDIVAELEAIFKQPTPPLLFPAATKGDGDDDSGYTFFSQPHVLVVCTCK